MRTAFKIPLQSEVEKYIKEKMGWPDSFCKHYADKFWNHYQASGWKLSSGNLIKDWRACFNSQWKVLKYREDIDLLYGSRPKINGQEVHPVNNNMNISSTIKEIQDMDDLLTKYRLHPTEVPFDSLGKYYDYLKAERLLKPMTSQEIEGIRKIYHGDNYKCRCYCVENTLKGYVNNNWTFHATMEARLKLTKCQ